MPCGHDIHGECLSGILKFSNNNSKCPLCREDLFGDLSSCIKKYPIIKGALDEYREIMSEESLALRISELDALNHLIENIAEGFWINLFIFGVRDKNKTIL